MKFRGRWPERDYAAATGQTINVSFPMQPEQKQWADDIADLNGRSLRHQMSAMIARVVDADTDLLTSQDLCYGPVNTGIMQIVGLIATDAGRYATEPSIVAGALVRLVAILFDVEATVAPPASISQDWDERVELCLYPLYEIAGLLVGDRAKPARFLDRRIIERLGDEFSQRIAAWYRSRVPVAPAPASAEETEASRSHIEAPASPPLEPAQHALWRGLQMIAALDPDRFPRRTKALRDLLRMLSRDPALPLDIRTEFSEAAGAVADETGQPRPETKK